MQRLNFTTLQQIQNIVGDDTSMEIGTDSATVDGYNGSTFIKAYLTLRFGYWDSINTAQTAAINKILDPVSSEIAIDYEERDDECGWQFRYKIINKK